MRKSSAAKSTRAPQAGVGAGKLGAGFEQEYGNAAGMESMPGAAMESMGLLGLMMAESEESGELGLGLGASASAGAGVGSAMPADAGAAPSDASGASAVGASAVGAAGASAGAGAAPILCPGQAPSALSAWQPKSMGNGQGKKDQTAKVLLKSKHTGSVEVGGRAGFGAVNDGLNVGKSRTERIGNSVTTSTQQQIMSTRTQVNATEGDDGRVVQRKKQSKEIFSRKEKNSDVLARTGKSGKSKVLESGYYETKDGQVGRLTKNEKEQKEAKAKGARDEAGVEKMFAKGKAGKLLNHVSTTGSVGDETGIDLESFTQKRDNELSFASGTSGVEEIEGGHEVKAQVHAGVKAQGSALLEGRDTDAFGNERVSRVGANGSMLAGTQVDGSATHKRTESGAEVAANAAAQVGVGGEGSAGATTQTKLADAMTAQAGVQVKGSGFAGVKGSAGATASHGKANAKVAANAEAMIGAEASGSVGANAAINAGGFDLVGARAEAEGTGLVGAEAKANGELSADAIKGLGAKGSASAMAGAKASGTATAGVSVGGVDADVVGEGEALAGAEADAQGEVSAGLLGVSAAGGANAFAGAMAGGEARFELGAGGLNFGLIGVSGEVSAGIGANASGKLAVSMIDVGVSGRAGATCGVGAGMGGMFSVDPSFPIRLPLEKLAENKVIPSSNIGDLIGAAASLVYKPGKGGKKNKKRSLPKGASADAMPSALDVGLPSVDLGAPSADVMQPGLGVVSSGLGMASSGKGAASSGMGVGIGMDAPAVETQEAEASTAAEAPTSQMSFDKLMVEASPEQREALNKTQSTIKGQLDATAPAVLGEINGVMSSGGGIYGAFMSMLGSAFSSSEDEKIAAMDGMAQVMEEGVQEVGGISTRLVELGGSIVRVIAGLVTANPLSLLDGGWEGVIDGAVGQVTAACQAAKTAVEEIIASIKKKIQELVKVAIVAAVSPLRAAAGSVASLVGGFMGLMGTAGGGMIGKLRGSLEAGEQGVDVEGMDGKLALPVEVSPVLATVEGPVREIGTFGKNSVSKGLNDAINFIVKGLGVVLGVDGGGMIDVLEGVTSTLLSGVIMAPAAIAKGAGEVAKGTIRGVVAAFQAIASFFNPFGWW